MKAIIWDFNGVVIDDEHVHYEAFAEMLAAEGHRLTTEVYYERYLGLDDWGFFRAALRDFRGAAPAEDEVDVLVERKADVYARLLAPDFELIPGAEGLIRATAREAVLAIASGARRREIEVVLERFNLRTCFAAIVSADEVDNGKPDPEGYLAAFAALLREHPELCKDECVVLEDAPAGIRAAHAAGLRCVAVATSRRREELVEAEAVVDTWVGLTPGKLWQLAASLDETQSNPA